MASWIGVAVSPCPKVLLKNLALDTVATDRNSQGSSLASSIHDSLPNHNLTR